MATAATALGPIVFLRAHTLKSSLDNSRNLGLSSPGNAHGRLNHQKYDQEKK